MIEVTALNVFPVKSLRGVPLSQAALAVRGLEGDRYWMVTDRAGRFLTQRQLPAMATIGVALGPDALILEHDALDPLHVDLQAVDGEPLLVTVWQDRCTAVDQGEAASRWLGAALGVGPQAGLRLVRFVEAQQRAVDPKYLRGEAAHTAFSDGFPYLVTAEASLAALNERLLAGGAGAVGMDRFRANIVVRGLDAFAEDSLDTLTAADGRYALGLRKPCRRCAIITTDQRSGRIDDPTEPLRTLMQMNARTDLPGAYFGQNATLLAGAAQTIAVGDRLVAAAPTR